MKIWYDTEFLEQGPSNPIRLISIGMAREDGAELYAINSDMHPGLITHHDWLNKHVVKYLPINSKGTNWDYDHKEAKYLRTRSQIREEVKHFVLNSLSEPQLWAWYGSYDHVVLAQLFDTMAKLPTGFPMWTNDLRQEFERLPGDIAVPHQNINLHRAIDDARWCRETWRSIFPSGEWK